MGRKGSGAQRYRRDRFELRLARQLAMARRERLRVYLIERAAQSRFDARMPKASCTSISMADKGVVVEEPTAGPELLFIPAVGR